VTVGLNDLLKALRVCTYLKAIEKGEKELSHDAPRE
jgi:hypothetical protein